jgi:hypothetical protein
LKILSLRVHPWIVPPLRVRAVEAESAEVETARFEMAMLGAINVDTTNAEVA